MANAALEFEIRANKEHEEYYLREPDGTLLGVLDYKNWYSSDARFVLGDWQLQGSSDNFWSTSYSVKDLETGEVVAGITFNWKWEAIITVSFPGQDSTVFILKATGFWNYRFTLLHQDQPILTISPDFRMRKMSYEYDVQGRPFFDSDLYTHLLTLISVYIANLQMTMMATVVAAS
ncbi:hypothetical protein ACO2Q8_27450 [Larkinella sp. VNQ87]|uniref:hypothetical protein n=1 Tax=Larkinella sp. VNQ87 TaxID=3400921 RepID=UPI003C126335